MRLVRSIQAWLFLLVLARLALTTYRSRDAYYVIADLRVSRQLLAPNRNPFARPLTAETAQSEAKEVVRLARDYLGLEVTTVAFLVVWLAANRPRVARGARRLHVGQLVIVWVVEAALSFAAIEAAYSVSDDASQSETVMLVRSNRVLRAIVAADSVRRAQNTALGDAAALTEEDFNNTSTVAPGRSSSRA